MNLIAWIASLFKPAECRHIYFPTMIGDKPIGQTCRLCGKFNSLKDLGLYDYSAKYKAPMKDKE